MSKQATLQLQLGSTDSDLGTHPEPLQFQLPVPLECPFCSAPADHIYLWGFYSTQTGKVRRFRCQRCDKTFNSAKLPIWNDYLTELFWKLAQLTIQEQNSVNWLADNFQVPESTLRRLKTQLQQWLAQHFQLAKQIHQRLTDQCSDPSPSLRVVFYDEGFINASGQQRYLLFTLDAHGQPFTLKVEARRTGAKIYDHLRAVNSQLGGIDVIIGDGSRALRAAVKALDQEVVLVQQVHQGSGKRVHLYGYRPLPERTALEELQVLLHGDALLPNTEAILQVKKKYVYPPDYSTSHQPKTSPTKNNPAKSVSLHPKTTLKPPAIKRTDQKQSKKKVQPPTNHQVFLQTYQDLQELSLHFIPGKANPEASDCPDLLDIHRLVSVVQAALPEQSVTSNRAEVFNSCYDRRNQNWGTSDMYRINEQARAWAVMACYPLGARMLLKRYSEPIPYSLLRQLGFLLVRKLEVV